MFWFLDFPPPLHNQFKDKTQGKMHLPSCKALLQPTAGISPETKSTPIPSGSVFSRQRLTSQALVTSQRVIKTLLWGLERNVLKNKQAGGTGKLSGVKLAHLGLSGWFYKAPGVGDGY